MLTAITVMFCRDLVGRWQPAAEDEVKDWMTGMTIASDGSFTCFSGMIRDGRVRLLSSDGRKINLKRAALSAPKSRDFCGLRA